VTVVVTGARRVAARIVDGLAALGLDAHAEERPPTGPLDALVHVADAGPLADVPFAETNEDAWDRGAEAPIREALLAFQAAYRGFDGRGGSIVAVLPTIAVTGAAGLVPFASACEGIRQLAKSAARAWGGEGVRVNCVTLPIDNWGFDGRPVPNRYGPSLPGRNGDADVAGAVALLLDPRGAGVTGATVGVDRGTVLAP
jgi:3-oxoacyl-[acyl-carrier protein] reductase